MKTIYAQFKSALYAHFTNPLKSVRIQLVCLKLRFKKTIQCSENAVIKSDKSLEKSLKTHKQNSAAKS